MTSSVRRRRHRPRHGRLGPRGLARVAARRRGPAGRRATRPTRSSPSCAPTPTARPGLVRDFTGLVAAEHDRAGARRRPAGLGPGQRRRLRDRARAGGRQARPRRRARRPGCPWPSGRGSPAPRSALLLGLPRRQGARPVRPVPRAVGPAAAGRAQHRPRRARARRRPAPTSGSGSACTRRPTGCSSPRCRGCATTCSPRSHALADTVEPSEAPRRRLRADRPRRSAAAARRQPARRARHPRAEGDPRPGHRRDVAARGPRRRRDGRRRPERDPVGRRHPQEVQPSAARASAPSTGCCAGCSGSTPRWRSTATARRSSAASSTRSAWREFNAVWERPENLPAKAEIADPAAWIDPRPELSPMTPAPGRRRRAPRRTPWRSADLEPGDDRGRRLLRRRRLARPARRPRSSRAARPALARRRRDRRPRAPGRLGRAAPTAVVAQMAGARRRRDASSARVTRRGRRARARRRPPGRRRYAVLDEVARAASAPPPCCSGTPATTRPRRCCSGWPAARAAGRWPACAGRFDALPPAAARRLARRHRHRLPGRGDRGLGRPAQRRPALTPGPGSGSRVLPVLEEELGPGVAAALARTADQLRDDMDLLDDLADARRSTALGDPLPRRRRSARCPTAVRRRVLRLAALPPVRRPSELFHEHVLAMDALLTDWHGQKWIDLPGPAARRSRGEALALRTGRRREPRHRRRAAGARRWSRRGCSDDGTPEPTAAPPRPAEDAGARAPGTSW